MTKDDAMAKALDAFDRAVADRERANIAAMRVDGVTDDDLDAFIGAGRAIARRSRADYIAFITDVLDAKW